MSFRNLILLACLPFLAGVNWPTNVVNVTDSIQNNACTADLTPWQCCTGNLAGTCTGYGGEDILDGLKKCELGADKADGGSGANADSHGCVLQFPCNAVFDNAEISIAWGAPTSGTEVHGLVVTEGFENGLDIVGCGSTTVLRSRLTDRNGVIQGPARSSTPAMTTAALWYMLQATTPAADTDRVFSNVRFRDLVLDGRSDVQPSFDHPVYGWKDQPGLTPADTYTAYERQHNGIMIQSYSGPGPKSFDYFEISNVEIRNFVATGALVRNVGIGINRNNYVHDIGCAQDFSDAQCVAGTPTGPNLNCVDTDNNPTNGNQWPDADPFTAGTQTCCTAVGVGTCTPHLCCTGAGTGICNSIPITTTTGLVGSLPCGCNSATETSTCFGWNTAAELNPLAVREPGFKAFNGGGIGNPGLGKRLSNFNRMERLNHHYGLYCDSGGNLYDDVTAGAGTLCRLDSNTLVDANMHQGTHAGFSWFSRNTITSAALNGAINEAGWSIHSAGGRRRLWIIDNVIKDSEGPPIMIKSYASVPIDRSMRIEGNVISNSGSRMKIGAENPNPNSPTWLGGAISVVYPWGYPGCQDPNIISASDLPTSTEIVGNVSASDNIGYGIIRLNDIADLRCQGARLDPLLIGGPDQCLAAGKPWRCCTGAQTGPTCKNTMYPPDWSLQKAIMARVRGFNINATNVELHDNAANDSVGRWIWSAVLSQHAGAAPPSSGTCANFVSYATTGVTDSSASSPPIGTCPGGVAGGAQLPVTLPFTL